MVDVGPVSDEYFSPKPCPAPPSPAQPTTNTWLLTTSSSSSSSHCSYTSQSTSHFVPIPQSVSYREYRLKRSSPLSACISLIINFLSPSLVVLCRIISTSLLPFSSTVHLPIMTGVNGIANGASRSKTFPTIVSILSWHAFVPENSG